MSDPSKMHPASGFEVPEELFGLLLASVVGVTLAGNLLLLDAQAARSSLAVAGVCCALVFVFRAASQVMRSLAWGLMLTYWLLCLVVLQQSGLFLAVVWAVVAVSAFRALPPLRAIAWRRVFPAAALTVLLVLGCRTAYTSFDMAARAAAGTLHQDTAFHASIAAMLKNYGVVSTGLNGLVETPYHYLSHALMAGISVLSGVSVIEVYGSANWIFFAPVLVLSLVVLCRSVDRTAAPDPARLWVLVVAALGLLSFLLEPWALWDSFFSSESYLVSLGLFALGAALLFKPMLTVSDAAAVLAATVLAATAKGSVGLMLAGLWLVRAVVMRNDRPRLVRGTAILALAAAAFVVFESATASASGIRIAPLHFVQYSLLGEHVRAAGLARAQGMYVPLATWALSGVAAIGFFLFHFLLTWAVVGQIARKGGARALMRNPLAVYSLAAAGAGILVIAVFAIPAASAYYFTSVAFFVALPGVILGTERFLVSRGWPDSRWMGGVGALLVLVGLTGFDRASGLSRPEQPKSPLVDQLVAIRDSAPKNVVLQASDAALAANPLAKCAARPFLFPAISERPWTRVIVPGTDGPCLYWSYLYDRYGVQDGGQEAVGAPVLLPGMAIQPFDPAKPRSP